MKLPQYLSQRVMLLQHCDTIHAAFLHDLPITSRQEPTSPDSEPSAPPSGLKSELRLGIFVHKKLSICYIYHEFVFDPI